MSKRRSLDDALTPEEETFLKSGASKPTTTTNPETNPERKEEPQMPRPVPLNESFTQAASPTTKSMKSASANLTTAGNGAINARIDPRITTALLRASVERRIEGTAPSTQRDIIAEALTNWLRENGYLLLNEPRAG